jgi:hypothetical protein
VWVHNVWALTKPQTIFSGLLKNFKYSTNLQHEELVCIAHYIDWKEGNQIFHLGAIREYDGNWGVPLVMFLLNCRVQFRVML